MGERAKIDSGHIIAIARLDMLENIAGNSVEVARLILRAAPIHADQMECAQIFQRAPSIALAIEVHYIICGFCLYN